MTERDLNEMGVRNSAHRARMISSLVMLREKLNRTFRGNKPKTPRSTGSSPTHSNGASPPSLVSSVDYVPLTGPSGMHVVASTHWEMQELRKYLWYHGNIPRHQAEASVQRDGDFLVRDSISQPGDFVLTCYWKGAPLHFVINRTEVKTKDAKIKVQYQFEENLFDRVSELITFYISNKKAISEMSGAVISTPVHKAIYVERERMDHRHSSGQPRSCPMSPIMMNSGWYVHSHGGSTSPRGSPKPSPLVSPNTTPTHSPQMQRRGNYVSDDPGLPSPSGSGRQSPSPRYPVGRHGSMPTIDPRVSPQMGRRDLSRQMTIPHSCTCGGIARQKSPEPFAGYRTHVQAAPLPNPPSDSNIQSMPLPHLPSAGNELSTTTPASLENIRDESSPERPVMRRPSPGPPPKPSRIPSIKKSFNEKPTVAIRNQTLYEDDGKDYTDYDQLKVWPSESAQHTVTAVTDSSHSDHQPDRLDKRQGSNLSRGGRSDYANKNQTSSDSNLAKDSGDDYDNNFGAADAFNKSYDGADYDTPRSNIIVKVNDNLKDTENHLNNNPSDLVHSISNQSLSLDHINDADEQTTITPTTLPKRIITIPDLNSKQSVFHLSKFESGILPPENKPLEGSTMATIKQLLLESEPSILAKHFAKVDLDTIKVNGFFDLGAGVFSGLELLTLPLGSQLRKDIIERHRCMSQFVALMILTCLKYPERSLMLHQWIQVATELRGNIGDLYGFSAVMAGLQHPQVKRLSNTLIALRQNYKESSMLYDNKLCGMLNTMDEGGGTLPLQNVCLPHIMPLVEVLEREIGDLKSRTNWEQAHLDLGLDIVLAHLDTARIITEQCGLYRVTGENSLRNFKADKSVLDMFRTEMHLKLLWGAKGATVNCLDRYSKFAQVLTVLSEKVEPKESPVNPETSV